MLARMLLAAAVSITVTAAPTLARDLTIVTRGEGLLSAFQDVLVQPFTAATDLPAVQESWDGGLETLRGRAKAGDNNWDLVQVDPEELATGCAEGLFEKLDWPAIGSKEHYAPQAVSDCGVGALIANVAYKTKSYLEWDSKNEKFTNNPAANQMLSYKYRAPYKLP